MGIPEGEEKERGTEEVIWSNNDWNFTKLISDNKPQIHREHQKAYMLKTKHKTKTTTKPHFGIFQTTENQRLKTERGW